MIICPRCQIEYDEGDTQCGACGSPLVNWEEPSPSSKEGSEKKGLYVCPKCKLLFESGSSCKRCGTRLILQSPAHGGRDPEPPRSPAKPQRSEERHELPPRKAHLPLQGLHAEATAIDRHAEQEPAVQRPRSREMASPSICTLPAADTDPEVKDLPPRAIQRLVNPRDLISSRWLILAAVAVILAVIGYVPLRQGILNKPAPPPPASTVAAPLPSPSPVALETERIKALLEDVRQANLKEDITLFMSCYSAHYKDKDRKRRDTLQTWKETDYEDLSYVLKNQRVEGDVAEIEVEWSIRVSPKSGTQPQENQVILGASLEKEGGKWRIKEILPVS